MKSILRATIIVIFLLFFISSSYAQPPNALYQISTINAILQGVYDGELTIRDLTQQGNFGIGTLNGLDGELVGLNGDYYQIKSNGEVLKLNGDTKIPFATVLYFQPDKFAKLHDLNYESLQQSLDHITNDKNYFYAVRIDGIFTNLKTRSIPKQTKPYKTLAEAAKEQVIFDLSNIKGTIVVFWCPQYVNGINVPGYHLHFISDDRKFGGHILTAGLKSGTAQIARINDFHMLLPQDASIFGKAALNEDYSKELKAVEQ